MSARFEIVRTDAGWHSRFRAGNGQIVWATEVYTRRRAALRAMEVLCEYLSPYRRFPVEVRWNVDDREAAS